MHLFRQIRVRLRGIVAENENIIARGHGQQHNLLQCEAPGYGVHHQIVADDDPLPSHLSPQQILYDGRRQRGGQARVHAAMRHMADHDHAGPACAKTVPEGLQFGGLPGFRNIGRAAVRIKSGAAVPGEVLKHGNHPFRGKPLSEGPGMQRHRLRTGAETAAKAGNDGIAGIGVHVGHRRKIHIDADGTQLPAQPFSPAPGPLRPFSAHKGGRRQRGKSIRRLAAADVAALVVHGNKGRQRSGLPQCRRQPAQLLRRTDIAQTAAGRILVEQQHMPHPARAQGLPENRIVGLLNPAKTEHKHGADHALRRQNRFSRRRASRKMRQQRKQKGQNKGNQT